MQKLDRGEAVAGALESRLESMHLAVDAEGAIGLDNNLGVEADSVGIEGNSMIGQVAQSDDIKASAGAHGDAAGYALSSKRRRRSSL